MASWQDWVDEKVDKIVSSGVKVGDKPYYDVVPKRDPNDQFDRAASAAARGVYTSIRGDAPAAIGQAIQATGIAPETGKAIREFGERGQTTPEYGTSWERGVHNVARGLTPAFAIPYAGGVTGAGVLPAVTAGQAVSDFARKQLRGEQRTAAAKGLVPPDLAASHTPGQYPSAISERFTIGPDPGGISEPLVMDPRVAKSYQDIYDAQRGQGQGQGRPGRATPEEPTARLEPGYKFNEPTRWDMARGLRQAGIEVPEMSREELIAALSPKPGQPGISNVGTMNDDQLRELADRRNLTYFKMSDAEMKNRFAPIQADRDRRLRENPALFTGGDSGARSGEPDYKRGLANALQMLQMVRDNPGKYSTQYLGHAINAIQQITAAMEVGPNAEADRKYKGQHGAYYDAQAGAIPAEVEEKRARAGYYRRQGENAPLVLSPGQIAVVPSPERGNPASEIARGLPEKPATPGAVDHMSEADKVQYQAASHLLGTSIDPEIQQTAMQRMDAIERKYSGKPKITRDDAYKRLKQAGKFTDDQINAKLAQMGLE